MHSKNSSNDSFFMSEALAEAEKAILTKDWPVGCVIVLDNEIISRAHNEVYSSNNKINHAEIVAIQKVSDILSERGSEAEMYVTYQPCPMCLGAIILNHFKKVVYGPDVDLSGGMHLQEYLPKRFRDPKYDFTSINDVMLKECAEVFVRGIPSNKKNQINKFRTIQP